MDGLSHLAGEHYRLEDGAHLVVPKKAPEAAALADSAEDGDVIFRLARRSEPLAGLLRPAPDAELSEETLRRAADIVAAELSRRRMAFDDKQKKTFRLLFSVLPGAVPVSMSAKPAAPGYAKKRSLRPSAKREAAQSLIADINGDIENGDIQSALEKTQETGALPPRYRRMVAKGVLEAFLNLGKTLGEDEPFYLPRLLSAHKAFRAVLSQLEPYLEPGEMPSPKDRTMLASITGDRGEGKHLVADVLVSTGRRVVELDPGLSPKAILQAVKKQAPRTLVLTGLVPISLRLATDEHERRKLCRQAAKDLFGLLKKEGLREGMEIILSGFAFNAQFGKAVGADAVCRTLWSLYVHFHHHEPKRRRK